MSSSNAEKNKAIMLEAFDIRRLTLSLQRLQDYTATELISLAA